MSIEKYVEISDENRLLSTIFGLASEGVKYLYYIEQISEYQKKMNSDYSWYWKDVSSAYQQLLVLNWCMLYSEGEQSCFIKINQYDNLVNALKDFYKITDSEKFDLVIKQKFISNFMEKHHCDEAEYLSKMKIYRDKHISHKDKKRKISVVIQNLRVCQDMFEHVLELADFFREKYSSYFHNSKQDDSRFILYNYKNLNEMLINFNFMHIHTELLELSTKHP